MKTRHFVSFVTASAILIPSLPGKAELTLNPDDVAFCNAVHSEYVKDFAQMNSSSKRGGGGLSVSLPNGLSIGAKGSGGSDTSSQTSESIRQSYESKDCDKYIETQGKVKIAEIEADSAKALEEIKADSFKYGKDVDLALGKDTNQTTVTTNDRDNQTKDKQSEDQVRIAQINADKDIKVNKGNIKGSVAGSGIGAIAHLGTAFINRPKNPPVNNQPAAAPVNSQTNAATPANNKPDNEQPTATTPAKNQSTAKAPADNQSAAKNPIDVAVAPSNPTAKLLAEWGWTKVACYPGAVFIMGMSDDAICVNPSAAIVGGQYQYDRASNQLIPLAASNPAPAPVSNPAAAAVEPAEQPPSDVVPVQEAEPQDADVF